MDGEEEEEEIEREREKVKEMGNSKRIQQKDQVEGSSIAGLALRGVAQP